MNFIRIIVILACCLPSAQLVAQSEPAANPITHRDITFTTEEDYTFNARIVLPLEANRNGYGVLLMGGGYGNDLNWTTPGVLEIDGERQQITISGESHEDAPIIAKALAERGYVVMHWSTIHREDPKRDLWPYEMTTWPLAVQLQHAKAALAAFRAEQLFEPDRVILCGHSLGAVRAANIAAADDRIAGLILMGAAQVTRTSADDRGRNMHSETARSFLRASDTDGSGTCDAAEFETWLDTNIADSSALPDQSFATLDVWKDGQLNFIEVSAALALDAHTRSDFDTVSRTDRSGLLWTEDILAQVDIPVLVLYGTLDTAQGHHAPILETLIERNGWDHVTGIVVPNIGHQLGPEQDGCLGPISDGALSQIAGWLDAILSD